MPAKISYSFYKLRVAMQQHMIASLSSEPDDPEAVVSGIVEALSKRHVLLWTLTPWGQPDGWSVRRMEDVQQVFVGDDAEIRLQMLLDMEGVPHTPLRPSPWDGEEDILRNVLQWAVDTGEIITIVTELDMYTGTATNVNDLYVSMDVLDFFGKPEGSRQFSIRDVQIVLIDSQEEKMYKRLIQHPMATP